jgi:GNAT superfamily N-acetyltransferase
MPLPDVLVDFLVAWESLTPQCTRYPWGTVVADDRYPDVFDANRAMVVGGVTPSMDAVISALDASRRRSDARYQQIELVDVEAHAPLYTEVLSWMGPAERFAVMVAGEACVATAQDGGATVVERRPPDETAWLDAKRSVVEDDSEIPEVALRQMIRRDVAVFFPAGRRLFEVRRDGETAGMATLLSLRRVGLVDDVATAPRHRRLGIAAALIGRIVGESRAAGDVALMLFTAEQGNARRVYERLGFSVVAASAQFHRPGVSVH